MMNVWRRGWLAMGILAAACGGGHDRAGADAGSSGFGADIATTLQCGPTPPVGGGAAAEFQRATMDPAIFPDALCNDGTPAILYFRPYAGAANENKWVINLHGGGACSSGPSCAARWCNCDSTDACPFAAVTTTFNRLTMTNASPPQKPAGGFSLRGGTGAQTNPYGDYNQVELSYCSSDAWRGTIRAVPLTTVNPVSGEDVTFTLHFLGAKILDADLAWLRQDGAPGLVYTLGGASTALPDLDEATEVIVTGDSAGGSGVITNLDYITDTLKQYNANPSVLATYGLLDAIVGPDREPLDYGTFHIPEVRSYDDYLTLLSIAPNETGARGDASCLEYHAADTRICRDETHVVRNHITTPFFVRMALRDMLISNNYVSEMMRNPDQTPMTVASFALRLHDELGALTASAEEPPTKAPGAFGPACVKHDTIHDTNQTFQTTITPPASTPQRLVKIFDNWRTGAGTPTVLLTESQTLADTNCP